MCHCLQCQKRTGSTSSVYAYFQRPAVAIRGETRAHRRTGDTGSYITLQFCPTCASTLHWDVEAMPDLVGIPVGAFADPAFLPPTTSIFVPQKHPWVVIPDGVPQNDGHSEAFLTSAQEALVQRGGSTASKFRVAASAVLSLTMQRSTQPVAQFATAAIAEPIREARLA
jgi:hypothetical protein